MSNQSGWIKLHRSIKDWEWYSDVNAFRVFTHLLLSANHKDGKWRGIEIKRGQFLTSLQHLSDETGLSVRSIRTTLKRLKSTGEVTSEATSRFTLLTVCNYGTYQSEESASDTQGDTQGDKRVTNKRQASDKQVTTNKNDKNKKNEENEKITPKPPRGIHPLHRRILLLFVSSVSDKPRPKAEMNSWNKIKDHVTEQDVETLERFYALPKSKDHDATWNRKTAAPQLMNQFTAQLEFAENYKSKTSPARTIAVGAAPIV